VRTDHSILAITLQGIGVDILPRLRINRRHDVLQAQILRVNPLAGFRIDDVIDRGLEIAVFLGFLCSVVPTRLQATNVGSPMVQMGMAAAADPYYLSGRKTPPPQCAACPRR
jgi:hypothetical protein